MDYSKLLIKPSFKYKPSILHQSNQQLYHIPLLVFGENFENKNGCILCKLRPAFDNAFSFGWLEQRSLEETWFLSIHLRMFAKRKGKTQGDTGL